MPNIFIITIALCMAVTGQLRAEDQYEKRRLRMVKHQIEKRGVNDPRTLNAMRTVPRHVFVPEEYQHIAYGDTPVPIGYGQTISQPYMVAYMTELAKTSPAAVVLEIGTGSGYQAAVLSQMVRKVYSIEIIGDLAGVARERLKALKYKNIELKTDDGFNGWKEHAPYDAIVVTAAAEYIPPPLIAQLKDGGRMIIPIGAPFGIQNLMLVTKKGNKLITQNMMPVRFVPLTRNP